MRKRFFAALCLAILPIVSTSDTSSFTIHIVGDSTVTSYKASAYPQTGWGQIIGSFFDGSKVKINNAAIGGRSSKTFIQEGRLETVKSAMQKGDFLFIQFGHNDRYFGSKAREVPYDSLSYWLEQYIAAANEKGALPVLISPVMMNTYPRNVFSTELSNRSGEYDVRALMQSLAKSHQIPFVDLNEKSYAGYGEMKAEYVSRYLFKYFLAGEYPNYPDGVTNDGTTHFQESGSIGHAEWIVEELSAELGANDLSENSRTELAKLVAAAKPRYALTVKSNVAGDGLISHSQTLPGGVPLTLHASPGSFGKKFLYWADDDCNVLTADSNFYGSTTLYRAATYTAMFEGGAACTPTAHGAEEISSSSEEASSSSSESSSSGESSSSAEESGQKCSEISFEGWKSVIDMVYPEEGSGTTDFNHAGFLGAGFFNIANESTSSATFKLESSQSASNAKLLIRYANGGTASRPMKITVDANTFEQEFPSTGGWDAWETLVIENVWLDAVPFDFKIESVTSDGGPNIDIIAFDIAGISREGCPSATTAIRKAARGVRNGELFRRGNQARTFDLIGRERSEKKK